MIDFVKIWIRNAQTVNGLQYNPVLDFTGTHSRASGEIHDYPITARYKNLEFAIKSATFAQISGSLHKFWNNGTNENDFTFPDLCKTIRNICETFQINPLNATIHNLEFGVNIHPDINATVFLKQVISYRLKTPSKPIDRKEGYFIEFELQDYFYKLYDKGKQYRTENTLRIEIKAMKSRCLDFARINTLADLLNLHKLHFLGQKLDKTFQDVILYDNTIKLAGLPQRMQKTLRDGRNPKYWEHLNQTSGNDLVRQRRARFKLLVKKYGKLNLPETIGRLIYEKWNELLKTNTKLTSDISGWLAEMNKKPSRFSPTLESANFHGFHPLSIVGKPLPLPDPVKRRCKSCGRDISHQRKNSLFCSAKYVGEMAAKRCRNMNSNPRNHFKYRENRIKSKGLLFDIDIYLNKETY